MISIENLTFGYKSNQPVICHLNLNLHSGQIHGIAGLNGSGKTTLLQLLFGLQKPDSGEIMHNKAKLSKKVMTFLPAENYFYNYITAKEYLALFGNNEFDLIKWNELFKIPLNQIIDEYSSGMKKKVAIMGIISQRKPIMILDEPFNNLDIETNRLLREILLRLKEKGTTIIVTSHIVETLTNLCDEIHYLESGKIRVSCPRQDFDNFQTALFAEIEAKNILQLNQLLGEKKSGF